MSFSQAEAMKIYIETNYYSLEEIASLSGVKEEKILALQTAQCIPAHSYEMRQILSFASPVADDTSDIQTKRYYHKSVIDYLEQANNYLKSMPLKEAAEQVKNHFYLQFAETFNNTETPGCKNVDEAWKHWVDGTWGICLKEINFDCMAQKEFSRKHIAKMMLKSSGSITTEEKHCLSESVNNYIKASMPFPPYGIRHTIAEDPIKKFSLQSVYQRPRQSLNIR